LPGLPCGFLSDGRKSEVIEDARIEKAISGAAAKMRRMPLARAVGGSFERDLRDIETAPWDRPELPGPTPQIITRADVESEVRRQRKIRAIQDEGGAD
jgi:hypothetical protein